MQKIERGEVGESELTEHEHMKESAELYEIIHGLTEGEAKLIIREAANGDGLKAWLLLVGQYAKRTLAKVLRMHREVINPKQANMDDLISAIASWEAKFRELERLDGNQLSPMTKMAALTEMCPSSVREMIFQNISTTTDYTQMKERIVAWVSNRVASGAVPMDVGAVEEDWDTEDHEEDINHVGVRCHRCGGVGHMMRECPTKPKGKGKGKGPWQGAKGKGKGKDSKGKGKGPFSGTCWNCGQQGHRASDCTKMNTDYVREETEESSAENEPKVVGGIWLVGSVEKIEEKPGEEKFEEVAPKKSARQTRMPMKVPIKLLNSWEALGDMSEETEEFDACAGTSSACDFCWDDMGCSEVAPPCSVGVRVFCTYDPCCAVSGRERTESGRDQDGKSKAKSVSRRRRGNIDNYVKSQKPDIEDSMNGNLGDHVSRKGNIDGHVKRQKLDITGALNEDLGNYVTGKDIGNYVKRIVADEEIQEFDVSEFVDEDAGDYVKEILAVGREESEAEPRCRMQFHLTDAKRMLASVAKMVEAGNEVHFSKNGSYVGNPITGQRIPLKKEGNVYIMEVLIHGADSEKRRGKLVVDSGAAESVMPWDWLQDLPTLPRAEGVRFVAANGGEIGNYGRKVIEFEAAKANVKEQVFKRQS